MSKKYRAEILCVGTELLLGDIVNTNAAFISRKLAECGICVYHQSVVGDNAARLTHALDDALRENDIIIMTGGLGPTYDDMTKECACGYFGCELRMHAPSLERIESFFTKLGREMTENNKKQALIPYSADGSVQTHVFDNDNGTAPGLAMHRLADDRYIIMLPGPPRECEPMFVERVMPYLQQLSDEVIRSRTVHIFGMGESAVEDKLRGMMLDHLNPTVAPYAKEGEVQLRVTAKARDGAACAALIAPVIDEIKTALGEVVYSVSGFDSDGGATLEAACVQLLRERGLKLVTAESCTGGLLAQRVTNVAGCSDVYGGGVVSYSNELKTATLGVEEAVLAQYGAVSRQTAEQMARGAAALLSRSTGLPLDQIVAVSLTGIAGPGGGTEEKPVGTVWAAACFGDKLESKLLQLGGRRTGVEQRAQIRHLAASNALDMVMKIVK